MPRYYLAYATANESWRFFWDLLNFRRLAAFDPGVAQVDIFIAVREVVSRKGSEYRDLGKLCRIAESNPRLRVRRISFNPDASPDMRSWSRCLSDIVDECSPSDYVLCLDRGAYGPLGDGWYVQFVDQVEREPGIALCGNSSSLEGHAQPPGPDHTCVQPYAFLGKSQLMARYLACPPGELASSCSSSTFDLTVAPFRHWRRGDQLSGRNLWLGIAGLLDLQRLYRATDPWAEWSASLEELFFLRLEEEIPASPLMGGSTVSNSSTALDRSGDFPGVASRIGIHVHLHFHDLWQEIRASLENLPPGFGLHVTTSTHNATLFDSITAEFPGAAIMLVPNRGRDMGPFLILLNSGAFDRYDYVCKIHSKKSPVNGRESYFGRAWRRRSIADLLGTPGQIRRILSLFDADPAIGVVGSATLRQPNHRIGAEDAVGKNEERIESFLSRCAGRRVTVPLDFFAGSMYWFRPRALQAIRALAIAPEDFPEEPCESDGTLAHVLERVVPMAAALSGYRVADAPQARANPAGMTQIQPAVSQNE